MSDQTEPSDATREADQAAAAAPHGASQRPTADEEQAAERNTVSPNTREHYQDMTERGANQQGEGRLG